MSSEEGSIPATVTPMIHVPDVRAAALWYQSIGFELEGWHEEDADQMGCGSIAQEGPPLDWAYLRLGSSAVMLNEGGRASDEKRREVDLYVDLGGIDSVDSIYTRLRDRVEIVEPPYDAFHGNRELIIRDLNRFWITFAEPARPQEATG